MKILVVDDHESVRKAIKRLLVSIEHSVETAENGISALEIILNQSSDNRLDLVITDYMMPRMNGKELAKKIKNSDNPLPVIVISSLGECLKKCPCFDHVINKHFEDTHLINIINTIALIKSA